MALIDQVQQQQPAPDAGPADPNAAADAGGAPDSGPGDGASTGQPMSDQDIASMQQAIEQKIPPEQQDAFKRLTVAGQKVLYSPSTSGMLKEELAGNDPIDKKLAGGAAGLMTMLATQSKGQIPPAVYIPAGAWLLLDIAHVMTQGGQQLTDQDVRDGLDQFSAAVMSKHGSTPDQVAQTVGGQQAPADAAPEAAQPGAMQ